MEGIMHALLLFSFFKFVCSLKEQLIPMDITGITHICPNRAFMSSFADTYGQCLQYCWMTTGCSASTWTPRSSVCRLHENGYSLRPENTSCLFTELSTSHLRKHHPCEGRPCDVGQTCVAVEAASNFICLPAPVAVTITSTTFPPTFSTATSAPTTTTSTTTTTTPVSTTTATTPVAVTTSTAVPPDSSTTTSAPTTATSTTPATSTTISTTTSATTSATSDDTTTTTTTTTTTPTTTTTTYTTTTNTTNTTITTTTPVRTKTTTFETSSPTTATTTSAQPCRYMGCYLDDTQRILDDVIVQNNVATLEWCWAKCREGNYKYAGLEFYRYCFCGNSYDESRYTQKATSECNTPCRGNLQQMCGGVWRLSMFKCR